MIIELTTKTKKMNKEEITTPEQFLVDFMVLLGTDELTWEAAQDHALKMLKDWREQYAQQVKRDEMEKAYIAGMQREASTRIEHRLSISNFDEWYSNHQNQEER